MKQILIEKYIKPSKVEVTINGGTIERWYNRYGESCSILGHPAEVYYFRNKNVCSRFWCESFEVKSNRQFHNGNILFDKMPLTVYRRVGLHRNKELPAVIIFNEYGELKVQELHKNGKFIKVEQYFNNKNEKEINET
jgi:hypothetical protein